MSVGAILMSPSTIVVALNAQLLRRLDLRPDTIVPTKSRPQHAELDHPPRSIPATMSLR